MSRFSCLLFIALLTHTVSAQEWTRFRGPDGNGIGKMSGLKNVITRDDYLWSVKLDGKGHSSPVLWGEKLFLTIASADGTERRLVCYDAASGKELWQLKGKVETHHLHNFNTFASATPVVDEKRVYVAWATGQQTEAMAVDHEGKELWRRDWPEFTSDHGFAASPILAEGVLILHTDSVEKKKSRIIGLDPESGKSLWEHERITEGEKDKHTTAYSTPAAMTIDGKTVVVFLQTNDGWKGLDPKTGKVVWAFDGEYTLRSVGSIAVNKDMVFATVGQGSQGRDAVALRPKADGDPEVVYRLGLADGLGYVPTPLFYEGRLYLWRDDGILTCREADTGKPIYKERIGGNFFSSPVIADGKLIGLSREGELVIVKTGEVFEILGRSPIGTGASASPAVANNRLYLRTDDELICVAGS